jgi:hypothetical protein
MPREPVDGAAVVLRNSLLARGDIGAKSAVQQVAIYAKTERAIDAFDKRQELSKLYEAKTELFPLPEEQRVNKRRG